MHLKLNYDRALDHYQSLFNKLNWSEKDLMNDKLSWGMDFKRENVIDKDIFLKIVEVFNGEKLT